MNYCSAILLTLASLLSLPSLRADSIVLGGGCFWCLDATYKLKPGVTKVTCGYAGGTTLNPTYEQVSKHQTDHAEVVSIEFDSTKTSLKELLTLFYKLHDPTQVDGQGNDKGSQYRSTILVQDASQLAAAKEALSIAATHYTKPITTVIAPLTKFWPAEEYHQNYFAKNPEKGYCVYVIQPKVNKMKKLLVTP